MARSGRKRKSGPRQPDGKLRWKPGMDRGTDELQARRKWFAQKGDPNLTSYPLGVMLANGIITDEQHTAGCHYAWLHGVVFGRGPSYAAVSYDGDRPGSLAWPEEEETEAKWLKWLLERKTHLETLEAALPTKRHLEELLNAAVFDRMPRWLLPVQPRPSDVVAARRLVEALEAITEAGKGRRAA